MTFHRWIGPRDISRMIGRHEATVYRRIKAGALDDIRSTVDNGKRKWCVEGIWKWHLTGSTENCWELADLQAFIAEHPLPDDVPGESRLAS